MEDRYAFKELFWMMSVDFVNVLKYIDDLISPQEIQGVIILVSILVLLNHSKLEVLTFEMTS